MRRRHPQFAVISGNQAYVIPFIQKSHSSREETSIVILLLDARLQQAKWSRVYGESHSIMGPRHAAEGFEKRLGVYVVQATLLYYQSTISIISEPLEGVVGLKIADFW